MMISARDQAEIKVLAREHTSRGLMRDSFLAPPS